MSLPPVGRPEDIFDLPSTRAPVSSLEQELVMEESAESTESLKAKIAELNEKLVASGYSNSVAGGSGGTKVLPDELKDKYRKLLAEKA